ncbi:MAG: oligosaccharide flippase family protein [Maritimibacter sp.]|uniref:oligosaccharide flippase family protein n=1 Tax=Maritimibacter sp. TaxID=2003363 RepID=UPI001D6371B9|nr:oligosaccharide flippase family protein [Maritimibacter sp.]MBL6427639.1 oligosaccharide flippase family protein [Maritimibacter sp.]
MSVRKPRSFARDVSINLIFPPLMVVITLISVPLYLAQIGLERYGILTLVWSITGMFAFFDFGMGAATTYLVAKARNGQAGPSVGSVILTTGLANAGIGMVLALVFWLGVGPLVFGNVKTDAALAAELSAAMGWITLLLPVGLVTSILSNAMDGERRFLSGNLIGTSVNIATVMGTLAVSYWIGPELPNLVLTVLITRILGLMTYAMAGWSSLQGGRLMTWSEFRSTLHFGGWQVVFSSISGITSSADRFVIGWIAGAGATALYAIPMNLTARLRFLPEALIRTLYPRLSEASGEDVRQDLGARALDGMLAGMALLIIPAILVVRPFFAVWLGSDYEASAGMIAQILLTGVYVQSCLRVLLVLQRASGRPDLPARLRAVSALPFLLALVLGVWVDGARGASVVILLRFAAECVWALHVSGLLSRMAPRVVGYLFLCLLAMLVAALGYGIWTGAILTATSFLALGVLALCQSPDIASLANRLLRKSVRAEQI